MQLAGTATVPKLTNSLSKRQGYQELRHSNKWKRQIDIICWGFSSGFDAVAETMAIQFREVSGVWHKLIRAFEAKWIFKQRF